MKRFLYSIILLVSSLFVSSCNKGEDILFSEISMCSYVNGQLISDGGNIYNIVKSLADDIPAGVTRLLAQYNVLRLTGSKSNEYDVKLLSYYEATVVDLVTESGMTPQLDSLLGHDAISLATPYNSSIELNENWLNILVKFTSIEKTQKTPSFNVVYDDVRSAGNDTLFFSLRHNGFGESFDYPNVDSSQSIMVGTYVSCPLNGLLPKESSFVISIDWDWFLVDANNNFTKNKERQSFSFKYSTKCE